MPLSSCLYVLLVCDFLFFLLLAFGFFFCFDFQLSLLLSPYTNYIGSFTYFSHLMYAVLSALSALLLLLLRERWRTLESVLPSASFLQYTRIVLVPFFVILVPFALRLFGPFTRCRLLCIFRPNYNVIYFFVCVCVSVWVVRALCSSAAAAAGSCCTPTHTHTPCVYIHPVYSGTCC